MTTVASAKESKKQAKGNSNNSNVNLNKNKMDNKGDDRYIYSCEHDMDQTKEYYMNKFKNGCEQDNDYAYENMDYDKAENKEYANDDNCEMFQGVCIDLKGNIFDVGQSLKYKETTEIIYNYTGKSYTLCVQKSIKAMKDICHHYIVEPTQASTTASQIKEIIFEQEMKDYIKDKRHHKRNMAEMYNVIHRQCTKELTGQMHTHSEDNQANEESDAIELLKKIIRHSVIQ